MSIVVWAACGLSLPGDLPETGSWKNYGHPHWAYETPTWQVVVEPAPKLKAPDGVKAIDPGVAEAMYVTVEPNKAGNDAYRFLNSVAVAFAKKCGGAVLEGPMGLVRLDANGEEIRN